MASARVFTTFGVSQVEVDFPRAPDPPKGNLMVPIGSGTFEFVRVRTRHDCLMLSFLSFLLSCTVYAALEVCA